MREDSSLICDAIALCLERNVPFAAFSFPGEKDIDFFSNPSEGVPGKRRFVISPWMADESSVVQVIDELDVSATLERLVTMAPMSESDCRPVKMSTDRTVYECKLGELIGKLVESSGKTVISRVEAVATPGFSYADWAMVAVAVIRYYADAFGFVYFTGQTGAWIGATPEKLLDLDTVSGRFSTMALAGTRKAESASVQWDDKNLQEHRYVVDYIMDRLRSLGIEPEKDHLETVRAGCVEHLMTAIYGWTDGLNAGQIVRTLHPTPAIAGWPLEKALDQIAAFENHPRYCYGGYVAVEDDSRYRSYVNLRSMHFDRQSCCFYGGGGITSLSVPADEWDETVMKISTLRRFLDKL